MAELDYGATPKSNAVSKIMRGAHVELRVNGVIIACAKQVEGKISNDLKEIDVFGDEWTHYILGQLKGECSITNYKVNDFWLVQGFKNFECYYVVNSPNAFGVTRLKLKNCIAEEIPFGAEAGEPIEEEYSFKFAGVEPLDLVA